MRVECDTGYWETMYREFSCDWKIAWGNLVIHYQILNPTDWPWYGEITTTLTAWVMSETVESKSMWTSKIHDYELRLFSCEGKIKIPLREVADTDSVLVTVLQEE